jgi:hypothetical protein
MMLFLENFGFLIFLATFSGWGIYLMVRFPLPGRQNESYKDWVIRFCETYKGTPCIQTKAMFFMCALGTTGFHVADFLTRH